MSKEKKESTEVAEIKAGALATAEFMDMADFGGQGFEGTDKDSYAIPFIQILQKMSPQVDEDDPKHIEGAKPGMFLNTVTGKVFDGREGLQIIPCAFRRTFIHWGNRKGSGDGGFKGEYTPEEVKAMKDDGKLIELKGKLWFPSEDGTVDTDENDYVADTRSHFIMVIEPDGTVSQTLLPLSSTQIKASKVLMTALSNRKVDTPAGRKTPPTFANIVRMRTRGMSNEHGSWSGVEFSLEGLVSNADIYQDARDFYRSVQAGDVNVDHNRQERSVDEVSETPEDADNF